MSSDYSGVYSGKLLPNQRLADYTTWRIGGIAKRMYKPLNTDDLCCFLSHISLNEPQESILWLGLGSNSLIKDTGFSGTVIITQGSLNGLACISQDKVRVEAGVSCAQMARFCARNGLVGGEFWAGIPGTMGGALRMNAGCFQSETWSFVQEVETINRHGERKIRHPSDFEIAYRHVKGLDKDEWFLSAVCKLSIGDKEQSLNQIKKLLTHRANTQPTSEYNCGSVFRNPDGHFAAQLIESCGLKGFNIGGARVSEKHANFIINHQGTASSKDIEDLIQTIQHTVYTQTNIKLIQEVHIIGD